VYVNAVEGKAIYYLTDDSEKPSGYGGTGAGIGPERRVLLAIDPLTGNCAWKHVYPNLRDAPTTLGPSVLTTASNLVISGDDQKNAIIYSADHGEVLWHRELGANESGGIVTYMLDGKQYIVFGAGDTLYAWSLAGGG
jgi:alcohol dehydrogenase (cytochrome c)